MSIAGESRTMTAAEFLVATDIPEYSELIRGEVVKLNVPSKIHGQIGAQIIFLLEMHCRQHKCGTVLGNDSGTIVETNPDTVRGPAAGYYSKETIPLGQMPADYGGGPPEVAFEVLSDSDRQSAVLQKIGQFLNVGVAAVCIVDRHTETVSVYRGGAASAASLLRADDTLSLPEIKPLFETRVCEFFKPF